MCLEVPFNSAIWAQMPPAAYEGMTTFPLLTYFQGQQAYHLIRQFHAALVFTKLFLMLGAQAEWGLSLLQREGGGIALHHGRLPCGACLGLVFFPKKLSTRYPRPRRQLETARARRVVRATDWIPGEWKAGFLLSSSKCSEES